MERVIKANSIVNPFQTVGKKLDRYEHEGASFIIIFTKIENISKATIDVLLNLIKINVSEYFKSCKTIGWDEEKEERVLTSKNACFLIASTVDKEFAGFSMFEFDMDYGKAVLYCCELQIREKFQRKGLGRHLLVCMEELARHFGMEFIRLTALTNNEMAMKFYQRNGFALDETDPNCEDYKILSKRVAK